MLKTSASKIEAKADTDFPETMQASELAPKLDELEALIADAKDAKVEKKKVAKLEERLKAAQAEASQPVASRKPPEEGGDPPKDPPKEGGDPEVEA